jgi:hypothetical protein
MIEHRRRLGDAALVVIALTAPDRRDIVLVGVVRADSGHRRRHPR